MQEQPSASDSNAPLEQPPLHEFALLIAKLAAKRWYGMQAEKLAASRETQTIKDPTCLTDIAVTDADASPQPPLPKPPKPRKTK